MPVAVLFPRFDHPAIEERYASWQSEMRLRSSGRVTFYDPEAKARDVAAIVDEEHSLVITDPLLIAPHDLGERLLAALGTSDAVLPVTNEAESDRQRVAFPAPYQTLREFELVAAAWRAANGTVEPLRWESHDPVAYLCATTLLDDIRVPLSRALTGRDVAIARGEYVHRWSSMRGQVREDLLSRIPVEARSVLDVGCGEGALGAAVKARQRCRVVGIELDPAAAALARRKLDDVFCGDARHLVTIINEKFDFIVGGDVIEHLDEPWTFLGDLRSITSDGGQVLLSTPNLANASIVGDLLQGRFDYVYMGLTCAGHVRFFTRQSLEDMLTIAGWTVVRMEPQPAILTPAAEDLMKRLDAAGVEYSAGDLLAPGYYVTARKQ